MAKIEISTCVFTGKDFEPIDAMSKAPPRPECVDGAIELTIDGINVITRDEWDLVDQLWAYMIYGIENVAAGRSFCTYFPDQALELRFDLVEPDEVSIEVRSRHIDRLARATVRRRELIDAVAREAAKALLAIGHWIPENRELYQRLIDQAAAL